MAETQVVAVVIASTAALIQRGQLLYHDKLLNQFSSSVEVVLSASCASNSDYNGKGAVVTATAAAVTPTAMTTATVAAAVTLTSTPTTMPTATAA